MANNNISTPEHVNEHTVNRMPRRQFLRMAATVGGAALAFGPFRLNAFAAEKSAAKVTAASNAGKAGIAGHPMQTYSPETSIEAKTFPQLTQIRGISQNQLNQHLELYKGYVSKVNAIETQITAASEEALTGANATYSP